MRLIAWGLAAVLFGLAVLEISMQPSAAERLELGVIFAVMALSMAAATRWLPGVARRYKSIRVTVAVLALAAFSIVIVGALAVGNRMFLSSHDLTLLLVVIAFGIVSAVGFAVAVSKPLTEDLERLSDSAALVADGNLDQSLALDRRDEIGRLATALDRMVDHLEAEETTRRDFFAAVGHDLRTPLASMQATVEAIKDGVTPDPLGQLETLETDINVLSALIDDLFLLAKIESGAVVEVLEAFDITEIADETLELLSPVAAARGVSLRLTANDRFMASGSATASGRVLRNLVDNAVRSSPTGGKVTVSIEPQSNAVCISVVDEGDGFPEEFRPVAFDRFTRHEPSRHRSNGGSGLGLTIAKGLVEGMEGRIWIDDRPGGRVSFTLPSAKTRSSAVVSGQDL